MHEFQNKIFLFMYLTNASGALFSSLWVSILQYFIYFLNDIDIVLLKHNFYFLFVPKKKKAYSMGFNFAEIISPNKTGWIN
jgi:hypothetical protein